MDCGLGDFLALLGFPAVAGAYGAALVAALRAGRGTAIDEVIPQANHAAMFVSLAACPGSLAGLLLALLFC